ncbi:MAG: PRC-barrel domain-containing protein [Candidatus Magasanikbacteria bacterium]
MRLSYKQLKELSVETVSGKKLGHVNDVIFEIEGQLVAQYVVKPSMISNAKLLVNRTQVVKFEKEKLIVDDSVGSETEKAKEEQQPASSPEPIAMREEMGN